ncbi:alpha-L-fucosidase-like isoform X1 [Gigantopelta aegis]|uniref:alpha-L-fucosidase-like isoform X1 n=1 Tax=Gigantopelta aegis TaxID=1735272 RepID=UPI001B888A50|nr:alpha-L-fucosidase-like isoform X1 [Gigantopelta aegis]
MSINTSNNFTLVVICSLFLLISAIHYEPNWKSIDSRPLPSWYDEGKIGIMLTWGVFSVPSFTTEWFWEQWVTGTPSVVAFMQQNYRPDFTYADFAPMFQAEFFDPNKWADIFQAAGARYVVHMTKHHEGFTSWPSKYSFNWNAMDVGPKQDLVGALASAIRNRTNIHFGLYHSLFEWYNPLFEKDQANKFQTNDFVMRKTLPELYEIVNMYKPDILWSDGDWMAPDWYWNSTIFLAWLYNESPVKDTVVVNDRWGSNTPCKHGGFLNCKDKFNPGKLQSRKWENCMSIDRYSWGYRRPATVNQLYSIEDLIALLVETVSYGGNLLVDVGPTSYGTIAPIFEERLRQMGSWLGVNGDAIYATKPWKYQNDSMTPGVWYTSKTGAFGVEVYAITTKWPESVLILADPQVAMDTTVSLLGYSGSLKYKPGATGGIEIYVPQLTIANIPCDWAWTFKMVGLKNA